MSYAVAPEHTRQVREYYDLNTARFLRWGRDDGTRNLHAALWPPAVRSLDAAMNHSNELVAREIEACPVPVERVLDLGCGVGGSLFYLGRRLPQVRLFRGVSLSPVQVEQARTRIPGHEPHRFRFEEGSFLELPFERFASDFSFAIEAFTHGPDPGRFFAVQARVLPRGGRLAVIDDCLCARAGSAALPGRPARLLDAYRRNWLLPGLRDPDTLKSIAHDNGFHLIRHRDLTSCLRIGRPRDRAIALLVRLLGPRMERSAYLRALAGGDAKQKCYREGLIRYGLLVFENHSADARG
ncbi:MAG: methyltransferase domain-containing protein [Desulfobacterales bacterium]|jgi:SAM-dependent methyltransferase|nr:methyltransferase domain-containing protein [Desulfobacterales bacterium]